MWLAVLFCLLLTVQRSFAWRRPTGRDALRLAALEPAGIFLGKAAALALELLALEVVLGVGSSSSTTRRPGPRGLLLLVATALCRDLGLAVVGTLYGGLAAGARVRETLLPLLLLPVAAPVLIGANRATEAALGIGDRAVTEGWPWVGLLAVFVAGLHRPRPRWPSGPFWRSHDSTERDQHGRRGDARPDAARALWPTGTRATRVIGVLALLGLPCCCSSGWCTSPPDVTMGDSVRIMYVHVPSAWLAYLAFGVTALCSLLYLWKRTRSLTLDRFAGASAEIGVLFTGLALVTGMLWGRPTWGVYWTWDARLTSTALLFLLFLGYLAIRRLPAPPEVRAKRAAIAGLIAFVDVPIVHLSVDWWRSLHQDATVVRRDLNAELDGTMLFTLFFGLFVFTLIYVWLLLHRQRQLWLEDQQGQTSLDQAIAERRAEATTRLSPSSPETVGALGSVEVARP